VDVVVGGVVVGGIADLVVGGIADLVVGGIVVGGIAAISLILFGYEFLKVGMNFSVECLYVSPLFDKTITRIIEIIITNIKIYK
jgi:hypothetical protein